MSVVKALLPCPAAIRLAAGLVLICSLTACKQDDSAAPDTAATSPAATATVAPPAQAVSAKVVAMGAEQLREAAGVALREQRLYAPSGDNAMEYYLVLRDKQPNDPAVASALTDLMPYALIATEQSIGRGDLVDAQRLYALMEKTDAQAPALPRLKQTIADAQASLARRTTAATGAIAEETARQALLQQQHELQQQQAAAQQLAQQQAEQQQAELAQQQAAEREAARVAAEREAAQRAAAQAPPPEAVPPPTVSNALRPISIPGPEYPREAMRAGESGEVQVEFTVGTDGSVTAARVVRAIPPRVFDRAALTAVNRWRFQPVDSPVTTRRTFAFNPGN